MANGDVAFAFPPGSRETATRCIFPVFARRFSMASVDLEQHQLAVARARLEGNRMAHLVDKVGQDTKNLRECASLLPAGRHRDYLNGLAEKLEQGSDAPD